MTMILTVIESCGGGVAWLASGFGPRVCFSADDGSGNGGGVDAPAPETVLFPNDNADKPDNGDAKLDGDKPDNAADWKEYEPDPNKTDEENAAAKAEHDKAKPKDGDKKDDDPANKVPEDGKYDLKMPEGVELDQEMLEALGPDFKDAGLTNGQAQKLADKFIEVQRKREESRVREWHDLLDKWVDKAKTDKEIGGDKWDATVKAAQRAVNTLGTPELREYLTASGGGNHPELIRVFAKVGGMIKEDNPATGGAEGNGKPAEAAHVLFPNDVPKG